MQFRTIAATLVLAATAIAATGITVTSVTATEAEGDAIACGTRDEMTERLRQSFGEAQTGLGLVSAARVLEVWSSRDTGTWTILMTDASGQSCLVAAGESWKSVPVMQVSLGEPA